MNPAGEWILKGVGERVWLEESELEYLLRLVSTGDFNIKGEMVFDGFWEFSHPRGFLHVSPVGPFDLV